jgi:hypothetical protein
VRANGGLLTEPRLDQRDRPGIERLGETGRPSNGFYVELSNMITGPDGCRSGPVSAPDCQRARLRRRVGGDFMARLQHGAGPHRVSDLADNHINLGSQVMWQTRRKSTTGIGPNSLESDESQYRLQNVDTVATTVKLVLSLSLMGEIGFLRRPTFCRQAARSNRVADNP